MDCLHTMGMRCQGKEGYSFTCTVTDDDSIQWLQSLGNSRHSILELRRMDSLQFIQTWFYCSTMRWIWIWLLLQGYRTYSWVKLQFAQIINHSHTCHFIRKHSQSFKRKWETILSHLQMKECTSQGLQDMKKSENRFSA